MVLGNINRLTKFVPFEIERVSTVLVGLGKGKTETLNRLVLDDISEDRAIVFLGNAKTILEKIPNQSRVLYINPNVQPFALNFLHGIKPEIHPTYADTLTRALVSPSITPYREFTFKTYFRYGIQTLLQTPSPNILELKKFITDTNYRETKLSHVLDGFLVSFWDDFKKIPAKDLHIQIESTLLLLYDLMLNPVVRDCIGQHSNKLVFDDTVVLIDLSDLGEENARLLGSMILAYLSIQDVDTTVYVDDAEPYAPVLRMLKVPMVVTLQRVDDRIMELADQVVVLRTSAKDSKTLKPDLHLDNSHKEPYELDDFTCLIRMDGRTETVNLTPVDYPDTNQSAKIIARCKSQCTQPPDAIEKRLGRFF